MMGLRKFSLKRYFFTLLILAMFCTLTWQSKAIGINSPRIYSTLTSDTTRPGDTLRRDTVPANNRRDTSIAQQIVDTFDLRISKDTLDAPVNYEAEDSCCHSCKREKNHSLRQNKDNL
jgi:hypothetical protein